MTQEEFEKGLNELKAGATTVTQKWPHITHPSSPVFVTETAIVLELIRRYEATLNNKTAEELASEVIQIVGEFVDNDGWISERNRCKSVIADLLRRSGGGEIS